MHLTRLAPTPSGYLHLGNLYNFKRIEKLAALHGLSILLRIDDMDQDRVRAPYVLDIFQTLNLFNIHWHLGPKHVNDLNTYFSQPLRQYLYQSALEFLRQSHLLYACQCSRSEWRRQHEGILKPCVCQHLHLSFDAPEVVWRLKTSPNYPLTFATESGRFTLPFPEQMQNCVVRQKNGAPAYQLTSLVDDVHYGVDFIVRGDDLLPSTLAQLWLAELLGYTAFKTVVFHHHQLLKNAAGIKLSKTAGDVSIQSMIKAGQTPEEILAKLPAGF